MYLSHTCALQNSDLQQTDAIGGMEVYGISSDSDMADIAKSWGNGSIILFHGHLQLILVYKAVVWQFISLKISLGFLANVLARSIRKSSKWPSELYWWEF